MAAFFGLPVLLGRGVLNLLAEKRLRKDFGEVAEWLNVAVSKTVVGRKAHREFESLPLRFSSIASEELIRIG
jgi:hypothetical protein